MKRKILLLPIMATVFVFCGGCSEMVTLTEQEANTVALYSAQIVSKYNRVETPGLGVPELEKIVPQEEAEDTNDPPAQSEDDTGEGSGGNEEDKNEGSGDEKEPGDEESEESGGENAKSEQEENDSYVSLSDAVGISGLSVEYTGYEMTGSLLEGSYFSLDATAGKKFVVLSFQVENTSSDTIPVDILSMKPRFRLNINGEISATAEVTLLMNDFNTLDKSLAPGESMPAQLIFEVDEELDEEISSLTMDATINEENSKIKLL